jgi:hypothetical protein
MAATDEHHSTWPAEGRYGRNTGRVAASERASLFAGDVAGITRTEPDPEPDPSLPVLPLRWAIGACKNPSSHRTVAYDDPALASEAVLLADLLLRLLERRSRASQELHAAPKIRG